MRKKKWEKLADESFWSTFHVMNVPKHVTGIPEHVDHVRFRLYNSVNDEHLARMVQKVKSVGMLDLDETDITVEGIKHLTRLEKVEELRLKGCQNIGDKAMEFICQLKGLRLLHLIGTRVTLEGFNEIGKLNGLQKLLLDADPNHPYLEEIYTSLPAGCEMIVNYKDYPFT